MINQSPIILLTGQPGVGKSTIIKKVVDLITNKAGGFYTREVRTASKRMGFEIVTLEGEIELLASKAKDVKFSNEIPFENYKINLDAMELVAVPALLKAMAEKKVLIIDEIGPMEIFSKSFCNTILQILENPKTAVVGTIVRRPYRFADIVKAHPRVAIKPVTINNRDTLPSEIYSTLK